jgi:hypothetical protein
VGEHPAAVIVPVDASNIAVGVRIPAEVASCTAEVELTALSLAPLSNDP